MLNERVTVLWLESGSQNDTVHSANDSSVQVVPVGFHPVFVYQYQDENSYSDQ